MFLKFRLLELKFLYGMGSFRSVKGDPSVCLLHPRLLSVYSVTVHRGKTRESDTYSLTLQYQFNLSRSAHALVGHSVTRF